MALFNLIIQNKYVYQDSAWKIHPKESREIGVDRSKNCLVLLRMAFRGERNSCCTSPASTTAVQAMPTATVSQDRVPPECSVCLEDFVVGDVTRQMPCKHIFHPHCILPWLKSHSCCPVCRFQMPAGDHHEHTQNESRSTSGGMSSLQMHIVCLCYRFLRYILTRWNDILYVTLCCIYVTIDFLP